MFNWFKKKPVVFAPLTRQEAEKIIVELTNYINSTKFLKYTTEIYDGDIIDIDFPPYRCSGYRLSIRKNSKETEYDLSYNGAHLNEFEQFPELLALVEKAVFKKERENSESNRKIHEKEQEEKAARIRNEIRNRI